jgi:hypothetical protein
MSRTSDAMVELALERAHAVGMQALEHRGWQRLFDTAARDACGCVGGLIGLATTTLAGALALWLAGASWWWLLPLALLGALCGLVIGQRRAMRRRQLALGRLHARLRALGAG